MSIQNEYSIWVFLSVDNDSTLNNNFEIYMMSIQHKYSIRECNKSIQYL